jgi:hypothetical protein
VYNDTGSMWRAAGAGVANTALAVGIGAASAVLIGTVGLPVLAVVGVGVVAGVLSGNAINNVFSGRVVRFW